MLNHSMHLNVIHRLDLPDARRNDAIRFQLSEAERCGLTASILVTYNGFKNREIVDVAKRLHDERGAELGIHCFELSGPEYEAEFCTKEKAIYLLPRAKRRAVIDCLFERFEKTFGYLPESIGSYILDAWTLDYIKTQYPQVKAAITNCFEEGVKMFQGNQKSWVLFSDGGPWGPFIPSRQSALCPAHDSAEAIDLVALPHLNRDMIMALVSRDDFFSSHPVNLFRARINEGSECAYSFRFIDQWIAQSRINGYSYYSLFVSCPWLSEGNVFVERVAEARDLYSKTLEYLRDKVAAGEVKSCSMAEFATDFRALKPPGSAQSCDWEDVLVQSKRQTVWHVNSHYRVAVDLNIGGAICDLRPYAGRHDTNLGPETAALYNGNYPFVLSREHRGGKPKQTCELKIDDAIGDIFTRRTRGVVSKASAQTMVLTVDPIHVAVGEHTVTVQSVFTFDESDTITVERRVLACSDPETEIEICETHIGSWGTLEYPADQTGLVLSLRDRAGNIQSLDYAYGSREIETMLASALTVEFPSIGTRLTLSTALDDVRGKIEEGHLFEPYHTLKLSRRIKPGQSLITCLKIQPR